MHRASQAASDRAGGAVDDRRQGARQGEPAEATSSPATRGAFEAPEGVTYLNCANLAPRLKCVSQAGHGAVDRMGAPWSIGAADWFADARSLRAMFAQLINAPAECVTLVPSVSYGIAVAARNLPVEQGENIVLIDQEYPSNYYSWLRLARERGATIRSVRAGPEASLTEALLEAIDQDTAVAAVANCRWTDGSLVDLARIGEAVRRHGGALVVDASQSLGAYPLDVQECQPDFLVTVGYKWLLGPYGVGYLYVSDRWHSEAAPLEESWLHRAGSDDFAALTRYTDAYRPGAARFGAGGAAHFYLLPMALAALAQIGVWTPTRINQRLRAWTDLLASQAQRLGLAGPPPELRAGHMIGLKRVGGLPTDLGARLAERGIHVGIRGECIRVAPHFHVSEDAVEVVMEALADALGQSRA